MPEATTATAACLSPVSKLLPKGISEDAVRSQLERILESDGFVNSLRLRRFLRFIVEEALQNRVGNLKEYTLGTLVFDKGDLFDPRFDPIVRVEAGRLRARLDRYNAAAGRDDAVLITLPRGTYVPRFSAGSRSEPAGSPGRHSGPAPSSISVLPFADHSAGGDQAYFCQGITEELVNALMKLRGLRVRAWPAEVAVMTDAGELRAWAQQLGVGVVLTGSVRKSGSRIRVTAQLVDARDGSYLWSEVYDRDLCDIFAVQEEISRAILSSLKLQIANDQSDHLRRRYTDQFGAYDLYLLGRYYWNQRSERGLKKAIECFEQTVALDPGYAPAYCGLSDSYALLGTYGVLPPATVRRKAMDAATKALEIDSSLAEAHTAMGHVYATYCWDWQLARSEYTQAIALNPSYATAHHWYAITYLAPMGMLELALLEIHRAEELDPVSVSIKRDIAVILYNARRYQSAVERCGAVLAQAPDFYGAYWILGMAKEGLGLYAEAVDAFRKGLDFAPATPRLLGALGHAYALAGKAGEAARVLERLEELSGSRHVSPFEFALVNVALRNEEAAFRWLQEACRNRCYDLVSLRVDPRFDRLRTDPRFGRLTKKLSCNAPDRPFSNS